MTDYGNDDDDDRIRPGDLVLCVKGGYIAGPKTLEYPKQGAIYSCDWAGEQKFVTGMSPAIGIPDGPPNVSGLHRWDARRFRRIKPLTNEERDEFLVDIKEEKRHVEYQ